MVGAAADGQLSAAAPSARDRSRVRFAVATPTDDAALRHLLSENPMRGAISLSFEREPSYFAGASLAGAEDITIIAREREHDRLVCMGRCVTRAAWINGVPRRVAYLGELRLDASAQGRFDILRGGYRFFHELQQHAPADITFTSIAADNVRARRLLERGLPGLPRYEFLTEFVTLLIQVGRVIPNAPSQRDRQPPERRVKDNAPYPDPASLPELVDALNTHAQRHHFAAVWTEDRLASLARHGVSADDFVLLRGADNRIVAAGALWDQRTFRQTVIRGYSPALAWTRPAINFAARVFGTPRLPAPGSVLAHAFVSPLALDSGAHSPELLPNLIPALAQRATQRGLEYLTLGFCAHDPRLALLRSRFHCRVYVSRFYRVVWPDETAPLQLDSRPILPEIAFL
jgi:hypothetical protein